MQVSFGRRVHQTDNRVSFTLVQDPSRIEFAGESGRVVVSVEIENADEFFAEGQTAHRIPELIDRRGINAYSHGIGQD